MRQLLFRWQYRLSTIFIHLGLFIMPDSEYKRELLRRLWELRYEVQLAVAAANSIKENTDGNE